jgi:L-alanine-DL-glutamate epimerase-like enolase superfamily enzyme
MRWTSWSSSTRCGIFRRPSRITAALEEFGPFWYEDPIKVDNLVAVLARTTRVPITASETLGTRWSFRELVVVNGEVVVESGRHTGVTPVVALRYQDARR